MSEVTELVVCERCGAMPTDPDYKGVAFKRYARDGAVYDEFCLEDVAEGWGE